MKAGSVPYVMGTAVATIVFCVVLPCLQPARAQAAGPLKVAHVFDASERATIQDFTVYKDKLYILASDYIMDGPPFEVYEYDPETKSATSVFGPREIGSTEEGGYRMSVLKDRLCVMGADTSIFAGDGKVCRYYRFDGEQWDFRDLHLKEGEKGAWGLHLLCITEYKDKLYATIGTIDRRGAVWESDDEGANWRVSYQTAVFPKDFPRMFEMIVCDDKLYANGRAQRLPDMIVDLWEYDGAKWKELDLVKGATFVWRFGAFKKHLLVSAYTEDGPVVYRFDGKKLIRMKEFKNIVNGFAELDGKCYAIDSAGTIWQSTSGTSWTVALRLPKEEFVGKTDVHQRGDLMRGALIEYKGALFVGSAVNGKVFVVEKN